VICDDAPVPSLLSAVGAGALIGASAWGRLPLAVLIGVLQLGLVAGWYRAERRAGFGPLAGAAVAAAAAVAADVQVARAHPVTDVRGLAGVLAALVGAGFLIQLIRRDGRPDLTAGLVSTIGGGALVLLGAGWLAVRADRAGTGAVAVALAGLAVAALVVAPAGGRWPLWAAVPVALAGGTGIGVLVAAHQPLIDAAGGAAIAATAAATGLATRLAPTTGEPAVARAAALTSAVLPLLLVAPAVLVVASVIID
jgi:hypothetical protein